MSKFKDRWLSHHEEKDYMGWLFNWSDRGIKDKEIISALEKSGVLEDKTLKSVFEIGLGSCNNLAAIHQYRPDMDLEGNDLISRPTLDLIGESLAKKIKIHEID